MRIPSRRTPWLAATVVATTLACDHASSGPDPVRAIPAGLYELVAGPSAPYGDQIESAQIGVSPSGTYRVAIVRAQRGYGPAFDFEDGLPITRSGNAFEIPYALIGWTAPARLEVRGDTLRLSMQGDLGATGEAIYVRRSDAHERAATTEIALRRADTTARVAPDAAIDLARLVRYEIDRNGAYWPAGDVTLAAPDGWSASGALARPDGREGQFPVVLRSGEASRTVHVTVLRDLSRLSWRLSFTCIGPFTNAGSVYEGLDSIAVDRAAAIFTYVRNHNGGEDLRLAYAGTARRYRPGGVVDTVQHTGAGAPWARQLPDSIDLWGSYHPIPGAAADRPVVVARSPVRYEGGAYCADGSGYRPGVLEAVP